MRVDAPDMTRQTGFSKEQERDGAAENEKHLASRLEQAFRSGLDTCFCWRAIVVCWNFLRSQRGRAGFYPANYSPEAMGWICPRGGKSAMRSRMTLSFRIWTENRDDGGALFRIRLPLIR
jgi:hypothetical protein